LRILKTCYNRKSKFALAIESLNSNPGELFVLRWFLMFICFSILTACHILSLEARKSQSRFASIETAEIHLKRFRECRNCDLSQAELAYHQLAGVDLRGALLQGCDLTRANLRGAKLQVAKMKRCDLSTATDLTDADLSGADLTLANLNGAILTRTKLCDAIMPDGKKNSSCSNR